MRWLLRIGPVALFGAIALAFAFGLGRDPRVVPSVLIDKPVPVFSLSPLGARQGLDTQSLKGQVTLVNVFASWCIPCREEHPYLMQLARERKVTIHGINYKDRPQDAEAWLNRFGDPFTRVGVDPTGRSSIEWGVYGVPESFLIDKEGRIRFKQVGPFTAGVVRDQLLPLIESLNR
jgi:cytochrome c biogenesis protein CcmG, thiol:disulfide interchange protein DsbE